MLNSIVNGIDDRVMEPGRPLEERAYPGFEPRQITADGLTIDYDVAVTLRDGVKIYTDVYRPAGVDGPLPAIVLWSAYGKHYRWPRPVRTLFTQGADVSDYAPIEAPDPVVWCPAGYAIVVPDPRGINSSEGDATAWSPQEGDDIHDTIEWIAERPWSNGKVGMGGASYFGIVQWFAGATRPPHLAALLPYDGMSDLYREIGFHGGMPNPGFVDFWNAQVRASRARAENWVTAMRLHPFFDEYWQSKVPAVENIDVPTYVVASWSDHAVHTRGSLSAFTRLGSKDKWLEVHGRNKWARMYTDESLRRQIAFFDRFLKGVPNEVDGWPKVRLEVREGLDVGEERAEGEWPLARTEYTPLWLDASTGSLSRDPVRDASAVSYDAAATEAHAVFSHVFDQDTELTGHFKLKLWVEALGADDMDLFASVQKFDATGELVNFYYITRFRFGHAAHGWLRVSHRELDEARSTPQQPFHPHTREQLLKPGEIVPVEIEIWPSSTLFRAGETMRVVVMGRDPFPASDAPGVGIAIHPVTRNVGRHVIHTGGAYDSHILLPVIPT
ncbi:CocE/NonD family hydrolase (plasmid) [Polymorphobacter sp. PAMC 29334]|uniref:CocE/NonD family hydrolase n=1 Tax=Polymorphobacter sp. PAMC 29334 TaxID=2862331 RepID=UPI001C76A579|nr:CocE/NonD family hydrolase [Polymorphobacter sp. PAMC 29334]QYE37119.1 CocE/NonD family hydrolase [Polymorphobacter sp. PAMC 29334]